jgi:hypothetical protein
MKWQIAGGLPSARYALMQSDGVNDGYERRAKELYPDGVPMEAYKKEPMRHGLYQDYMTFANQLGTILEKK